PPKSLMEEAISYTYKILKKLSLYVTDGRYKIDDNMVENSIRPLAVGRLCCTPHNLPYVGNTIMLAL
ncbi:MAG: transposase, partial [Bacteroidales bacterium]|nr:transposase [Bacteroidales bacterium]